MRGRGLTLNQEVDGFCSVPIGGEDKRDDDDESKAYLGDRGG